MTAVVQPQGERHQRSLAIRAEDTGHVSKLCVKTLFISEKFHSSLYCYTLGTVISAFARCRSRLLRATSAKREFYAGHCIIIHLPGDSEPIRLLEIPTSHNHN